MNQATRPTRRQLLSAAVATGVLGRRSRALASRQQPPNVLFILADDLGYADLSCYGRPDYRTPHLDRMASQGMRFTSAYSASPVCTPTRCAFVTGRYPSRLAVGLEEPLSWRKQVGGRVGLPPEHPTIASLLKGNGYETALVGKWHLGYLPEHGPNRHGFDHFFGILSGGVDYFTHKDANGEVDLFEDLAPVERVGYLTDLLTDRAVQFLLRRRERPFYLSLHYTAPHWPWEGPADTAISKTLKGGFDGFTAGGSLKAYASMMKSLDDGVGRVMKALGEANLDRRTLVVFTSDNGGERFSYNWPFFGRKGELFEGGLRVPAIVRWPTVVPAGGSTAQVAVTMDWTATILAATETQFDSAYPLDGEDMLPTSKGLRRQYQRTLFWRHGDQDAVRSGDWKYLRNDKNESLFNLALDERERADFRESHSEVFTRLKAEFDKWQSQVLPRPPPRK